MAIILLGRTECSICGVVFVTGDEIVATSHFIADLDDPLYRFSDSGVHKNCFLMWEYRADFVEKFNRTVGNLTFGNGTYHYTLDDGQVEVRQPRVKG
ncbi:hypothetical protein BH18ACI2_BH18ACI2_09690 [soil metagenome]